MNMGILAWLVLGAIAGWIASLIMKTDASQGALANIIVGIIGAVVGGFVFNGSSSLPSPAKLWKNGSETTIETSTYCMGNSVYALDTNIYMAGHDNNKAALWINGQMQILSSTEAYANSVFVTSK